MVRNFFSCRSVLVLIINICFTFHCLSSSRLRKYTNGGHSILISTSDNIGAFQFVTVDDLNFMKGVVLKLKIKIHGKK